MSRPDALDSALRKLALKVTEAALNSDMDDSHDQRVETLKVAGNYFAAAKRVKKGADEPEEGETMSAIQKRIAAAGQRTGGHA